MKTTKRKTADFKNKSDPAQSRSSDDRTLSSPEEDLRTFFIDSLKDIYWAEKALMKALPKMSKNATSETLVATINDHLLVTEEQVSRLEEVFEIIGKKASTKKCEAMKGLIKEGKGIIKDTPEGPVRDSGIIAASQKIEHYEIASYSALAAFAQTLGEDEVYTLLQQTLDEEKEAELLLTEVAANYINFKPNEENKAF